MEPDRSGAERQPRGRGEEGPEGPSQRGVIGWYEYVDLPDWGIAGIKAKVDTGARTSALHVSSVRKQRNGKVRFDVVLQRKQADKIVSVEAPVLRRTRIRSSTGDNRTRYIVPVSVRLGDIVKTIEVSLVSRDKMLFRMLLGRSAFSGEFLIDASRHCMLSETLEIEPPTPKAPKARKARKTPRPRKAPDSRANWLA